MSKLLFIASLVLFAFISFSSLNRPLLWNDEATTAVFAESILENGYPKIFLGKNNINPTVPPNKSLCVRDENEAYICTGWLQYYVALPGVYLAHNIDDIYLKTTLTRLPFAILGFLGTIIFGFVALQFLDKEADKLRYLALYLILISLSVFYGLHLGQVRYYSAVVFLFSLAVLIYTKYVYFGRWKWMYFILLPLIIVATYLNYYPSFVAISVALFINTVFYEIVKGVNLKRAFTRLFPLVIGMFVVGLMLGYFETIYISRQMSKFQLRTNFGVGSYSYKLYFNNLFLILEFFIEREFLFELVILEAFVLFLITKNNVWKKTLKKEKLLQVSLFLSLMIAIYFGGISRTPLLFSRYFIVLVPLIDLTILLNLILVSKILKKKENTKAFFIFFISLVIISGVYKAKNLYLYSYELSHFYRGPLGYVIFYIKANYENPKDLIIATNYEELSYVYYLESKVIIGGVSNNLEADLELTPDIIIPRKDWGNLEYLDELKAKANYKKITFDVYDYQFNNIAEPSLHLFKTKLATREEDKLKIYVK